MTFARTVRDFLKRFPALAVFALVGFYLAARLTSNWRGSSRLMLAFCLAVALSATAQVWLERLGTRRTAQLACAALSVAVFAGLWAWFEWIGASLDNEDFGIRYLLVFGAVAALFASALCPVDRENRRMPMLAGAAFLGFASSMAIFGCVALVFLALDKLFGVKFRNIYEFLWYASVFSVFPVAFVLFAAQRHFKVPRMTLKVLLDYILLPVFLVNLVILVAYFAKCLARLSLPNGEVTWLVSAACALWLAFHFLCSYDKTRFASFFRAWSGFAIPPLLALQAVAIWLRVRQYGLTPIRYLAVAFSVFVLAAVALSIIRRGAFFRHVYLVFAAMAVFSALSPLNAIDASVYAQRARIRRICAAEGFKIGRDFFSKASPEFPQGFPQEAMDKVNKSWEFISGYRRSCGFYVKKAHNSQTGGTKAHGEKEYRAKSVSLLYVRDTTGAPTADISEYKMASFLRISWSSGEYYATETEVVALKEQDPPIVTIPVGSTGVTIRASALIPYILDRKADRAQTIHPVGDGLALGFTDAYIQYFQLGEQASPTNIVPASAYGNAIILFRGAGQVPPATDASRPQAADD